MKKYSFIALALLLATACSRNKTTGNEAGNADSLADTLVAEQAADSTIYGTSGEFGMSTFSLINDKGDTLYVTRTAMDGTDGKIYGDLNYGERYAMTTRDNNEAIGVLINLTQLDKQLTDYEIRNGHVVVGSDTIEIESLTAKELKIKD